MVIAGSDKTTRRRGLRRQRDASLFRYGPDILQAREKLGLSLESVQDRTGVRRFDIEALEAGDLSRFTDERTALIAVRRVAETLGLDAFAMQQSVGAWWRSATVPPVPPPVVGPTSALTMTGTTVTTPPVNWGTGVVAPVAGHLSRYPGDTTHLKAFTQTAQVPQVASARPAAPSLPPGLRFDTTDAVPVTWCGPRERDPAPLGLQVAVWSTVLLLALGVVGIAVHHWRPGWLAKIHLVSGGGPSPTTAAHSPGAGAGVPAHLVTDTLSGSQAAAVAVHFPVYDVVVTTGAPCWIHVTSPASFGPLFSATVPAGTTKTFTSTNGQLSVELGASHATVTVRVFGQTVPHWSLTPATAPFFLTFHSATG